MYQVFQFVKKEKSQENNSEPKSRRIDDPQKPAKFQNFVLTGRSPRHYLAFAAAVVPG
jgi:hypothetical protein